MSETNLDSLNRSFDSAQSRFPELDTTDYSGSVVTSDPQTAESRLRQTNLHRGGYYPVDLNGQILAEDPTYFLDRPLLMLNNRMASNNKPALSPAIISRDPKTPGQYLLTIFDQPFDPEVGISAGMHWNLSVAAQTRVDAFGGHGENPSGFEQGHMSSALIAVRDERIADSIIAEGDIATHGLLKAGVQNAMGNRDMLPIKSRTTVLDKNSGKIAVLWHDSMRGPDDAPLAADFPGATRLMIGAGFNAIDSSGKDGIVMVERLVKEAIRGA